MAAAAMGTNAMAIIAAVKIGILRLAHHPRRGAREAWPAVFRAVETGLAVRLRPWLRFYAPYVESALAVKGGTDLITQLADADPEGWRGALVRTLAGATGEARTILLDATSRHADKRTIEAMRQVSGKDVAEVRRRLRDSSASRLYLRTFGGISIHRGSWTGPPLPIEKKRVRMLLGVLAAQSDTTLTRDMAVDIMWPDADPVAAVNNLNQTVFQLRRYIDPDYRGGESPDYVISSSEQVTFNPRLVRTDLAEIRDLPKRLASADWKGRNKAAARAIELVRGEFLADLRYEDWASAQQRTVHFEVRSCFLAIATRSDGFDLDVATRAASALVTLDPYDETAVLVLAHCLEGSGRRVAARDLIVDFARRMHAELEEPPSPALAAAAQRLGGVDRINVHLTLGSQ
jgi:DNA-binding SARP family transcriptional activator